jgi:hypothetical protein
MRIYKKDCGAEFEENDKDWQDMVQRIKELDDDIANGELDVIKVRTRQLLQLEPAPRRKPQFKRQPMCSCACQ